MAAFSAASTLKHQSSAPSSSALQGHKHGRAARTDRRRFSTYGTGCRDLGRVRAGEIFPTAREEPPCHPGAVRRCVGLVDRGIVGAGYPAMNHNLPLLSALIMGRIPRPPTPIPARRVTRSVRAGQSNPVGWKLSSPADAGDVTTFMASELIADILALDGGPRSGRPPPV